MFSRIRLPLAFVTFLVSLGYAQSESDHSLPVVVPLQDESGAVGQKKVRVDTDKPGEVFAIRIHNDVGHRQFEHPFDRSEKL